MPIVSLAKVSLMIPDTSGVIGSLYLRDESSTPFTERLPRRPGSSSGRGVRMLMIEPMPPDSIVARPVLYTSTAEMPSAARLAKSNERDEGALPPEPISAEIGRGAGMKRGSGRGNLGGRRITKKKKKKRQK